MKDIISGMGMALREEIPRKPLEKEDYILIKNFVEAFEEVLLFLYSVFHGRKLKKTL